MYKNDSVIRDVILEVQNDLIEEGIHFTEDEIFNMVDAQFKSAAVARYKGIDFRLERIGNFMFKDLRYYYGNAKNLVKYKYKEEVNEEEYKKMLNQVRKETKERMKPSNSKPVNSLEELQLIEGKDVKIRDYKKFVEGILEKDEDELNKRERELLQEKGLIE